MNRFLTYEGGQPVHLDDFDFIQDSFSDMLKGLCRALQFGERSILFSDPVSTAVSGNNTVYTTMPGGYIAIDDEIYPVQTGSLTLLTSHPVYFVVVSEKYQTEILSNNMEVQLYERRYAKLSATYAEGDIYVNRADVMTVHGKILAMVTEHLDTETTTDMNAQMALNNVLTGRCNLTYHLKKSGEEKISFEFMAIANDNTTMTAPEVNGKRKLFAFDASVKWITGVYNVTLVYADSWNETHEMTVQLIFDGNNCYIASANGSPLSQMPDRCIAINTTFKI